MSHIDNASLAHWWGLLFGLIGVGLLMSVLRSWLGSRQQASLPAGVPLQRQEPDRAARTEPASGRPRQRDPAEAGDDAAAGLKSAAASGLDGASRVDAVVRDPLTGLATRLWLEDRLAAAVMRAEARQRKLALLCIDLEGFQAVEGKLGKSPARHGEVLLREVGLRLRAMGRTTDTTARMDDRTFVMLLDGDPDSASAALVAERVRRQLQRPYLLQGREIQLSCSIGIVLYPQHGPRSKLLARADAAMLAAKQAGGNMHCFFEERMEQDAEGAIALQQDLRHAMATCEGLALHYQPKINGRSGELTGAEALLRWDHPVRGPVPPAEFVAIAERFGLIGALGHWVIEEACRQVRAWMDDGLTMAVAVNLSAHQLRQGDVVDTIQSLLKKHAVPAELITFEVNECVAMEDAKATLRIFEQLAGLGVSLSIDDFGTGYSKLSELRRLPAREIKLDRTCVQDVDKDDDARAVARASIKLAHALGLSVVAEGVETDAQLAALRRMGCDEMQGDLFAKPMPAKQVPDWACGEDLPARWPSFRAAAFNEEGRHAGADRRSPEPD